MPPSRRDELVDAAMQVFGRHGFHATGIDRLLNEAGISRMTLYNHFRSKDELIVAALRRRDEIFRNRLMRFVEASGGSPRRRILALFEFLEAYLSDPDFRGCMFINAAAEYEDPAGPIRRAAAEHKRAVTEFLRGLCVEANLPDPEATADHLRMLIDGAIVSALVLDQSPPGVEGVSAARRAREAADRLLETPSNAHSD